MRKNQIITCEGLIIEWKKSSDPEKAKIRNELFGIMKPFMDRWILSVMDRKGLQINPGELRSQSWTCFEYCLFNFKVDQKIPLPNHFYAYTKFHLAHTMERTIREAKRIESNISTPKSIESISDNIKDPFAVCEDIDELKFFRETLPEKYHSVFDDAIASLSPANRIKKETKRLNETPLPYERYYEAKKVFKLIIQFLLTR